MIKARARFKGRDTIIIGLSRESCDRLLAGQPIRFDGEELLIPGLTFLVLGGETEDEITEDLRSLGLAPPTLT